MVAWKQASLHLTLPTYDVNKTLCKQGKLRNDWSKNLLFSLNLVDTFTEIFLKGNCTSCVLFISFYYRVRHKCESEVAQLCLTLCNPMGYRLPRSSIHRIFQASVLEWVAISFSRGSSRPRDRTPSPTL